MAKVQIIMPVTLDGFLPDKNEELMEWLRTDRNGFPYWEERATFNMYPHYGMLDLMDAKERHEKDCTFFMKVEDEKSGKHSIKGIPFNWGTVEVPKLSFVKKSFSI